MWICTICSLIKILKVCFVVLNWRVVFTSIDVFACLTYIFLSNYFFFFALSQIPRTYTFKQFSNTTILNFFWYLPSLYLYDTIDCRNGWYSRPFLSIRFSFDNIIFLFHESKYNWKILSTFLKNHFAILLNICHLTY